MKLGMQTNNGTFKPRGFLAATGFYVA